MRNHINSNYTFLYSEKASKGWKDFFKPKDNQRVQKKIRKKKYSCKKREERIHTIIVSQINSLIEFNSKEKSNIKLKNVNLS